MKRKASAVNATAAAAAADPLAPLRGGLVVIQAKKSKGEKKDKKKKKKKKKEKKEKEKDEDEGRAPAVVAPAASGALSLGDYGSSSGSD